MIAVGENLDTGNRRGRVVALIAAVIGPVTGGYQLASERVLALAPAGVVSTELRAVLERLVAIATPRCGVCFEPGRRLHPACAAVHAEQLAAATAAKPADRTIHQPRGRR